MIASAISPQAWKNFNSLKLNAITYRLCKNEYVYVEPFPLQGLDILREAVESLIKVNKHCALAFYLKSILPA